MARRSRGCARGRLARGPGRRARGRVPPRAWRPRSGRPRSRRPRLRPARGPCVDRGSGELEFAHKIVRQGSPSTRRGLVATPGRSLRTRACSCSMVVRARMVGPVRVALPGPGPRILGVAACMHPAATTRESRAIVLDRGRGRTAFSRSLSAPKKVDLGGVVVKSVITPACHVGGRGFESRPPRTRKPQGSALEAFGFLSHCGFKPLRARPPRRPRKRPGRACRACGR